MNLGVADTGSGLLGLKGLKVFILTLKVVEEQCSRSDIVETSRL